MIVSFFWGSFFTVFFISVLTSLAVVYIGTKLVYYADKLTVSTGLSGGLVGFVLVAAVTSIPELVSTFLAAAKGLPGLAAGNIFGSNAANVAIFASIILIFGKKVDKLSKESLSALLESLLMLAVFVIIYFLLRRGAAVNAWIPAVIVFIFYLFLMKFNYGLSGQQEITSQKTGSSGLLGFLWFSVLIVFCSWVLVLCCKRMTELPFPGLGRPLGAHFIGTLVLAVSTSVPEMVTTVAMVKKGFTNMAFGNIFGSNVFNLVVFAFAPLFTNSVAFWQGIPSPVLYTILAVLVLTVLMGLASTVKKQKVQALLLMMIILVWFVSFIPVF